MAAVQKVSCSHCGKTVLMPAHAVGTQLWCLWCGKSLVESAITAVPPQRAEPAPPRPHPNQRTGLDRRRRNLFTGPLPIAVVVLVLFSALAVAGALLVLFLYPREDFKGRQIFEGRILPQEWTKHVVGGKYEILMPGMVHESHGLPDRTLPGKQYVAQLQRGGSFEIGTFFNEWVFRDPKEILIARMGEIWRDQFHLEKKINFRGFQGMEYHLRETKNNTRHVSFARFLFLDKEGKNILLLFAQGPQDSFDAEDVRIFFESLTIERRKWK